jgi:hypothetical protein
LVKPEFTGLRDLSYSQYHRTLPETCAMIDIDSIEWRNELGIVAFIETAIFVEKEHFKLWQLIERKNFEVKVLDELQNLTNKPAFVVIHNPELTTFWVFKIRNQKAGLYKAFSREQYSEFIQNLGIKIIEVKA